MIPVRKKVVVKEGVAAVELLLTPHLYSFKEQFGVDFSVRLSDAREVLENYADVFFLAAVNAWVLDGHGTAEDFPLTRGDFHAWSVQQPREFGDCVKFAIPAITGKTPAELARQAAEKGASEETKEEPEGKKKRLSWIGRLLKRF